MNKFFHFSNTLSDKARITLLFVVCVVLTIVLIISLYDLQITQGPTLSSRKHSIRDELRELDPSRGSIYIQDSAGDRYHIVASQKKLYRLIAKPSEIEYPAGVLNSISAVIDIGDQEERLNVLSELGNKERKTFVVARGLEKEKVQEILDKGIEGISAQVEYVRYYPSNNIAAQVIGYVGYTDRNPYYKEGIYGIERSFDTELSGQRGVGQAVPELGISEERVVKEGAEIYLTLDHTVQFKIEKELQEVYEKYNARSASAVFMNPTTGEIIAMASVPSFNLNEYNIVEPEDIEKGAYNNKAIQGVHELGSVFKPLTMAFGIDTGVITPNTTYTDTGIVYVDDRTIRNYDLRAYGERTMTQVLENSLNTGVVWVLDEKRLGRAKFLEYVYRFQLDKRVGVELPGEQQNNIYQIANPNFVSSVGYANSSFGQGIAFSLLRFLTSFNALANKGTMVKPYIVEKIIYDKQRTEITESEELGQPISASTAQQVTNMLISTVENGYGRSVQIPGYNIAAKTGTAQVPRPRAEGGGYYSDRRNHSFVGYAPAHSPRFIGILFLEQPQGVTFSSVSLGPVFRDITEFMLNYYEVPPDR